MAHRSIKSSTNDGAEDEIEVLLTTDDENANLQPAHLANEEINQNKSASILEIELESDLTKSQESCTIKQNDSTKDTAICSKSSDSTENICADQIPSTEAKPTHLTSPIVNPKPKFILGSTEDCLEDENLNTKHEKTLPQTTKASKSNQPSTDHVKQPQIPLPRPKGAKLPPQMHQRLFFRAATSQSTEDVVLGNEVDDYRAEPALLLNKSSSFVVPIGSSVLNRVSTCNSSLTHIGRDSTRRFRSGAQRKIRRRAILKNGECNILQSRTAKHRLRFLQDIFTTLVDAQWRWTLIVFALSFLLSWLGFAVLWWLIMFTHGDLEPEHLPPNQEKSEWKPCVSEIYDFTSCFLFSIETQHTIGYGARTTSEECPEAIFIMCMQSIAGVMISAFMVGIVFAKMTRPKHRTQTLLFSRNAVVCQRDGFLSLMFRVGDMRKSHIIGASIRAQLIRPKTTKEGEILNHYQTELIVNADGCDGDLFFIWPMTIVHKIDEESPLYYLSAADMLQDRFEIVVILEGTIESTGQTTQARSSYVAAEVLWGHRFEPVVSYNKERQGYAVNYSKFDNTLPVDTPLCSGAELNEFYRMQDVVSEYDHLQTYYHPLSYMHPHYLTSKSVDLDSLMLNALDPDKYIIDDTTADIQNEHQADFVQNIHDQIRSEDYVIVEQDRIKQDFSPISDSSDTESLYSVHSKEYESVNRRMTVQSVKNTLV